MRIKRVVVIAAAILAMMAVCSFAQGHAKPRSDNGRRRGNAEAQPERHGRQAGRDAGTGIFDEPRTER